MDASFGMPKHDSTFDVIVRDIVVAPGLGFRVALDPSDSDDLGSVYASGQFPPEQRPMLDLLRLLVPVPANLLDLGAHVGGFSFAAATLGYQVTAVEAAPRNIQLLSAGILANQFTSVKLIPAAISDKSGFVEFCAFGCYGHVATSDTLPSLRVQVASRTVTDVLKELGWDRVDFIKMDIEGSEVAALRGMSDLLARPDAPPILYESNGHTLGLFGLTPRELRAELVRYGYHNYVVEPGRLVPVRADDVQAEVLVDILAVKRLPDDLGGWVVAPPPADQDLIQRFAAAAKSVNPDERAYVARILPGLPRRLRKNSQISMIAGALRADSDPKVRDAASPPTDRPWWARWIGSLRRS